MRSGCSSGKETKSKSNEQCKETDEGWAVRVHRRQDNDWILRMKQENLECCIKHCKSRQDECGPWPPGKAPNDSQRSSE